MSVLFSPFTLGRGAGVLTLSNRIVVAPMCQYAANDGCAGDWHLMHWGSLLNSGAALVTLEATAVLPEGRITPRCLGLWDDATQAALAHTLQRARALAPKGVAVCLQLAHAGRKASSAVPWEGGQLLASHNGGWPVVAPSPLPHAATEPPPQALDAAGLQRVQLAFVQAALRAQACGVDAIELHAAHGYLLHQFLSPLANQRTDAYGGSLEARMRFPLEVFAAVRAAYPGVLGVRISATDWVEGGWDLAQSQVLAQRLAALDCDFIHVSSGGVSPQQRIPTEPLYQVPLAQGVRAAGRLPTTAVGLITEPEQAQAIVASGQADLVALARGVLYDPRWGWHAAAALGAQVSAHPAYWRCPPRAVGDLFAGARVGQR